MLDKEGYYINHETFFESLSSPKMIKSLTRIQRNEEKKRKECLECVKSPQYMDWLSDFVKKHGYISDSPSFPQPYESKEDFYNVKMASYLYMLVDDYSSSNYYPSSGSYNLKYNDTILEIKMFMGQGGMCFIRENSEAKDYFDYDDIISNNKSDRKDKISSELKNYKNYLMNLLDEEIPEQTLRETFDSAVKEHKIEHANKSLKKTGV